MNLKIFLVTITFFSVIVGMNRPIITTHEKPPASAPTIVTQQSPIPAPAPPVITQKKPKQAKEYYTQQNFEMLRKNNQQLHAPLMILLDELDAEKSTDKEPGSLTWTLSDMITQASVPIIVSCTVVYNLLVRTNNAIASGTVQHDQFFMHGLSDQKWDLYDVPNTQFILFIPKKFIELEPKITGLRINTLPRITNLLPKPGQYYTQLVDWISKNKKIYRFKTKDFERIFEQKNEQNPTSSRIWDIVLNGHGTSLYPFIIGGLSIEKINELLTFFDRYIFTGVLDLETCSAGGKNLSLLEFDQSGISRNHNYILIVAAVSESFTYYSSAGTRMAYTAFYNYAAQLQDRGDSLKSLLLSMYVFNREVQSVHGAENIPQVWLPRGLGFQTFNIDQRVFILGDVLVRAHADENRPIAIRNAIAALVYPNVIRAPLEIYITKIAYEIMEEKEKIWKRLPMITESALKNTITRANREMLFNAGISIPALDPKDIYLYPQFIGMNRSNSNYYFSEVVLPDKNLPYIGVIRFLRDSLLDIAARSSSKTFFIDRLTGLNDLSALLAVSRLANKQNELHPLEELLISRQSAPLTLEKIIVNSRYDVEEEREYFSISFCIGNTAWQLTQNDVSNLFWNFRPFDFQVYSKKYQSDVSRILSERTIAQPPISQVLKRKAQEIAQRKIKAQQVVQAAEVSFINDTRKPLQLRARAEQAGKAVVYFNDIILPGKTIELKPTVWPLEIRAWDASRGVGNYISVPLVLKSSDRSENLILDKKEFIGAKSNRIFLKELPDRRIQLYFDIY